MKLMLDRKEEHLVTGNRPSAAAHIKAGVSADGMITAFDAESWGTGGAGADAGFPLPYIYRIANRRRAHKDVFINTGLQRPMRAPGPSAGIVHHRDHDGRARGSREDGSGRVPHQEPAAGSAERDVAQLPARRRRSVRLEQAASDRRPGARIRSRPAWASRSARGAAAAAARRRRTARSPPTAASIVRIGTQDIGTGTRTIVAMVAAEALGLPDVADHAGDRRHAVRRQRRLGRQHDRRRAPRPAIRIAAAQGARGVEGEGRAGARRRRRRARRRRRPHPGQGHAVEGPVVGGRVQADRSAADHRRWRLGSRACRRRRPAACSSPK